ncbi:unnamed protein product [Amoebophrya sp. A120]|nr:unnamed protein product [Amoebophrya sp. A120]|eukprot:GSA120T00005105001.1
MEKTLRQLVWAKLQAAQPSIEKDEEDDGGTGNTVGRTPVAKRITGRSSCFPDEGTSHGTTFVNGVFKGLDSFAAVVESKISNGGAALKLAGILQDNDGDENESEISAAPRSNKSTTFTESGALQLDGRGGGGGTRRIYSHDHTGTTATGRFEAEIRAACGPLLKELDPLRIHDWDCRERKGPLTDQPASSASATSSEEHLHQHSNLPASCISKAALEVVPTCSRVKKVIEGAAASSIEDHTAAVHRNIEDFIQEDDLQLPPPGSNKTMSTIKATSPCSSSVGFGADAALQLQNGAAQKTSAASEGLAARPVVSDRESDDVNREKPPAPGTKNVNVLTVPAVKNSCSTNGKNGLEVAQQAASEPEDKDNHLHGEMKLHAKTGTASTDSDGGNVGPDEAVLLLSSSSGVITPSTMTPPPETARCSSPALTEYTYGSVDSSPPSCVDASALLEEAKAKARPAVKDEGDEVSLAEQTSKENNDGCMCDAGEGSSSPSGTRNTGSKAGDIPKPSSAPFGIWTYLQREARAKAEAEQDDEVSSLSSLENNDENVERTDVTLRHHVVGVDETNLQFVTPALREEHGCDLEPSPSDERDPDCSLRNADECARFDGNLEEYIAA